MACTLSQLDLTGSSQPAKSHTRQTCTKTSKPLCKGKCRPNLKFGGLLINYNSLSCCFLFSKHFHFSMGPQSLCHRMVYMITSLTTMHTFWLQSWCRSIFWQKRHHLYCTTSVLEYVEVDYSDYFLDFLALRIFQGVPSFWHNGNSNI